MAAHPITPSEFAAKWKGSTRTERAAAQEHFIDLCRMLGFPTPNDADPHGDWYAFEKGATKQSGGEGWADVWKKGHFAWEYKGKRKDLGAAYQQLLQYREALENPPCLVVCDLERFEIHTNFTGTKTAIHSFTLDDLLAAPAEPLRLLKAVMQNPEALKPAQTREQVTEVAATQFAGLAEKLHKRGHEPHEVAHFLNKLLFCFFAEDIGVLPRGLVTRLIDATRQKPAQFSALLKELFGRMADGGGYFGTEHIEWFNGGLFDGGDVLPLEADDLAILLKAAKLDWSSIEPAILGTLFERGLDPAKRSQLGAHYTDKASILRVVEPVVMAPLRREFTAMKARVLKLLSAGKKPTDQAKAKDNPNNVFRAFLARLRAVRVLDPACGSGNFLYVTLQLLKDLEKEALIWGAQAMSRPQEFPGVGPEVVHGIELNEYASELARVTIWIGEIQWMVSNGFGYRTNPILRPLQSVECRDAILDLADPKHPRRAAWPKAEYIVGNPPFLGSKRVRGELGDGYVNALFEAWDGQVPREADFVCYWHEKARQEIESGRASRAGLLATQGIRGGANQLVLKRIKETGQLFFAWSDLEWVVEGAAVRISIIGQDDGSEVQKHLDGKAVEVIHADLTGGSGAVADLTQAVRLKENRNTSFMGDSKGGAFDISYEVAQKLIGAGPNPHGKPNTDVVVPWVNGFDITGRPRDMFMVDFGTGMSEKQAALYEAPFEYVKEKVRDVRAASRTTIDAWWLHERPRPELRKAIAPLQRFIVTVRHAQHRLFTWVEKPVLPDSALIVFARDDDFTFGVLHSRAHVAWALAKGTQLEDRPRYTPTTTFETYPFPWRLDLPEAKLTPEQRAHRHAIAAAAKALHQTRARWLNPPELTKLDVPVAPGIPPRILPASEQAAAELSKRTLTDLYNEPPTWLRHLHEQLDAAVLAAYGWPEDIADGDLLARLLKLNQERSAAEAPLLVMAKVKSAKAAKAKAKA